jgi:predicted nuclease of predicted toxin-antitoxin system
MRFLVDDCAGPTVATWLRSNGHEVFSVFVQARGMDDDNIIQKLAKKIGF